MLEMPIRTGRKLQDAARQLREGVARRTGERQQVNSLHRQRMTCSGSLQPFANTQDWTNSMGMSPSGRFRTVEAAQPRQKVFSRDGIRWGAAWGLLAAVMILCAAILLSDAAGIGMTARNIGRLNGKIADMTGSNAELQQELELNAGDVSVCTEAVKYALISAFGAPTIRLTAPQEAGAVTAELGNASTGWMTGSAGE